MLPGCSTLDGALWEGACPWGTGVGVGPRGEPGLLRRNGLANNGDFCLGGGSAPQGEEALGRGGSLEGHHHTSARGLRAEKGGPELEVLGEVWGRNVGGRGSHSRHDFKPGAAGVIVTTQWGGVQVCFLGEMGESTDLGCKHS